MSKIIAAEFKVSTLKNSLNLLWAIPGGLLFNLWLPVLPIQPFAAKTAGIILIITGLILFIKNTSLPYLQISSHGIDLSSHLTLSRKHYPFKQIDLISFINPDHSITLQLKDGEEMSIPIHPLSKKDRIRCIFLVESAINRQHI